VDATSDKIDALFARLVEHPDDDGAALVLGDALAEVGDMRGELVHVQHALASASKTDRPALKTREAALLHGLRARLVGPRFASLPTISFGVRSGFLRTIDIADQGPDDAAKILASLLESQDARLLESIRISWEAETVMGLGEVLRRLIADEVKPPASLRRLVIGSAFENDRGDRPAGNVDPDEIEREDLRQVLTMFPRLRELELDLGIVEPQLAPLATKHLERLTWITPRMTSDQLKPLGRSVLPSLARFELWIGAEYEAEEFGDYDEEADLTPSNSLSLRELGPVLAMLDRSPALRELSLGAYTGELGTLLEFLGRYAFVKHLDVLELSHFELDDPEGIVDFMTAEPALKRVVLREVHASERVQSNLERRLGPRLEAEWAKKPTQFRYVSNME
jgi:uncharacterized protein (TIGR02996 family)